MKIIEDFESTLNFEKLKEFDIQKTKVFKYITYKKRTEQEVRRKLISQNTPVKTRSPRRSKRKKEKLL